MEYFFRLCFFEYKVKEIYLFEVFYIVILEGMYYVCVVVYNCVFEFFDLVCFDGVIVIIDVFYVIEVDISNVYVREGLVIDVGRINYWVISINRCR